MYSYTMVLWRWLARGAHLEARISALTGRVKFWLAGGDTTHMLGRLVAAARVRSLFTLPARGVVTPIFSSGAGTNALWQLVTHRSDATMTVVQKLAGGAAIVSGVVAVTSAQRVGVSMLRPSGLGQYVNERDVAEFKAALYEQADHVSDVKQFFDHSFGYSR